MATVDTSPSLHLWIAVNRATRSVVERLSRQVEGHGLTLTEFAVLEALLHKGALPIGEIGEIVLLTSGSMTYVVDKLERRGLLVRRRSDEDRRVLYADLTDQGRQTINAAFAEHAALLARIMAPLDRTDKRQAIAILGRLRRTAEALPDAPGTCQAAD